jgi:hypothetical protein
MLNMNMNPLKYLHDVEISAGIATWHVVFVPYFKVEALYITIWKKN